MLLLMAMVMGVLLRLIVNVFIRNQQRYTPIVHYVNKIVKTLN